MHLELLALLIPLLAILVDLLGKYFHNRQNPSLVQMVKDEWGEENVVVTEVTYETKRRN